MGGSIGTAVTAIQQRPQTQGGWGPLFRPNPQAPGGFGNIAQIFANAIQGQQPPAGNQSPVTPLPQVIDDTQGQPFLPQNQPPPGLLNMLAAQLMGRNRQNGQYSQMRNRFFNNDRW